MLRRKYIYAAIASWRKRFPESFLEMICSKEPIWWIVPVPLLTVYGASENIAKACGIDGHKKAQLTMSKQRGVQKKTRLFNANVVPYRNLLETRNNIWASFERTLSNLKEKRNFSVKKSE